MHARSCIHLRPDFFACVRKKVMNRLILSRNIFFAILVFFIASCTTHRTIAIEEGWELLGETKVNFVTDKDEIPVTSRNEFTAIKFRVEDKDVRLNYLKIYFRNGDVLQPAIDQVLSANQDSKVIELAREGRPIDKIEFKYHTTGGKLLKGRASVLVFGKKYYAYGY
jgi:hypothetical protein